MAAARGKDRKEEVSMTAAAIQRTPQEKILDMLNRLHKRG